VARTGDGDFEDQGVAGSPSSAGIEGTPIVNGLSIDVEEYFQVWAFAESTSPSDWHLIPSRIEASIDTALRLFDDAGVNATFFTLGWIAERHGALIRRIVDAGHEIASHGYDHQKVTTLSREQFRQDVVRAKGLLEDAGGSPVVGYRAPSFSIGAGNLWALDVLHETGHLYSSSIYPISHDHYGMPDASRFPFRDGSSGILEVPMSTVNMFGRNFPCAGGGYFRLAPYRYFRWALRRLNQHEGRPAVFYFHPWELDPEQPRMKNISLKARFRHYVNLSRMERDLARLLSDFSWDRMDRVFMDENAV
jgi:polysaccharide deacetylase family protein (PEP-CTERM system associated)